MTEVNMDGLMRGDTITAIDQWFTVLLCTGLEIRTDLDSVFWKQAAMYKARFRRISLAACFALSLTQRLAATLYPSNHGEFDPIASPNPVPIFCIR